MPFRVLIDGAAPGPHTGWMPMQRKRDAGSTASLSAREATGSIADRTFEITLAPGVEAYVFTFG